MCWSTEASLTFTLIEAATIFYLIWRDKGPDKWLAFLLVPAALQEFGQFISWIHLDTCDTENKIATKWSFCLFAQLVLFYCITAYKVSDGSPLSQKIIIGSIILSATCSVAMVTSYMFFDGPKCAYKGEHGHLIWPKLEDAEYEILFYVGYYAPFIMVTLAASPVHIFLITGFIAIAGYLIVGGLLNFGEEMHTVCCTYVTVLCGYFVMRPQMMDFLESFLTKYYIRFGLTCFMNTSRIYSFKFPDKERRDSFTLTHGDKQEKREGGLGMDINMYGSFSIHTDYSETPGQPKYRQEPTLLD